MDKEIPIVDSFLDSGNIKYEDGRICTEDLTSAIMVSNRNKERLMSNIEDGIKELAEKLYDKGYDLLSCCEGHNDGINKFKYVKICCEEEQVGKLNEIIDKINQDNGTTITYGTAEEDLNTLIEFYCRNKYNNPSNYYIEIGKVEDEEKNYKAILDDFDKYEW